MLETKLRLWLFVAGCLILYRLGYHIPLPGIVFQTEQMQSGGFLGWPFGEDAAERLPLFALGLGPIFICLLWAEIGSTGFPSLRPRRQNGEPRIGRWVVAFALAIAALQAWRLASSLEQMPIFVTVQGPAFQLQVVATLVASTAFLAWLCNQLSARLPVSGFWILYAAGPVGKMLANLINLLGAVREGVFPAPALGISVGFPVFACALLVIACGTRYRPFRSLPNPNGRAAGEWLFPDVWPVMIGQWAAGVLAGVLRYFGWAGIFGTTSPFQFGQPDHIALSALFMLVLFWMRRQGTENPPNSVLGGTAAPPLPNYWILAAVQIFIASAGEMLVTKFGLAMFSDGAATVIIVRLALELLPVSGNERIPPYLLLAARSPKQKSRA